MDKYFLAKLGSKYPVQVVYGHPLYLASPEPPLVHSPNPP